MSIDMINPYFKPVAPIEKPASVKTAEVAGQEKGKVNFNEMFLDAIKEVDSAQDQADKKIEDLITGKNPVTTHDAMIALEKADVAFQLMNQVRASIVRAYEEVMRTQV